MAVPVGYTIELVVFGMTYLLWTSEEGTAGGPAYHAQRQRRSQDGSLQPVGTQLTASRIQPKRGSGSPACGSTSRLLTAVVADANAARGLAHDKTRVSGPCVFGWQVGQFDALRALLNSSMAPQWAPEAALPIAAVPQAAAAEGAPAAQPMPPSAEQVLARRQAAPAAGDTSAGAPPAREAAMQIGSAECPPQCAGSMRQAAQQARQQDAAASLLTLGDQPAGTAAPHQRQAAPSIAEVHAAFAAAPALAGQWVVGEDAGSLALRCMRDNTTERLLRVAPDGQWQVCIVHQQLSSSLIAARMPEHVRSVAQLQDALRVVSSLHICSGNCSPRFQPLMQSRHNEAIFAAGDAGQPTARVFRDTFRSGGKVVNWTVRAVAAEQRTGCQLVKLRNNKGMCHGCQRVGHTLRSACHRFERPQQPQRRQLGRLA